MPKKPKSSYLFYCDEVREELKAANPDKSVVDLAKLQGEGWKALPPEEVRRCLGTLACLL